MCTVHPTMDEGVRQRLFSLLCYNISTISLNLVSHDGDNVLKCKLLVFSDLEFAGRPRTTTSAMGLALPLEGQHVLAPSVATPKGQMSASHSSTVVWVKPMQYALRVEGSPALDFPDAMLPLFACCCGNSRPKAGGDPMRIGAGGDPSSATSHPKDQGQQNHRDNMKLTMFDDSDATIKSGMTTTRAPTSCRPT